MPLPDVTPVVQIPGIALVLDVTNGYHDSASSISTRALSTQRAVAFAAFGVAASRLMRPLI